MLDCSKWLGLIFTTIVNYEVGVLGVSEIEVARLLHPLES